MIKNIIAKFNLIPLHAYTPLPRDMNHRRNSTESHLHIIVSSERKLILEILVLKKKEIYARKQIFYMQNK